MKTIVFDESCVGWTKYTDLNNAYLGRQKDYLNEKLRAKGYLYLSEIYETLGITWTPTEKNICYLSESGPIDITYLPYGGSNYLVMIR